MRYRNLVASVGVLAVVSGSALGSIIEDAVYNPDNGHYYAQVEVPGHIPWQRARAAAEEWTYNGVAGHLATITSDEESRFVVDHFEQAAIDMYWLGGYQDFDSAPEDDPAAGWRWVTGEEWGYTNWTPNSHEPNDSGPNGEDVLQLWRADWWLPEWNGNYPLGRWNDAPVDHPAPGYVVEFVPAPGVLGVLGIGVAGMSRRRQ